MKLVHVGEELTLAGPSTMEREAGLSKMEASSGLGAIYRGDMHLREYRNDCEHDRNGTFTK